MLKYSKLFNLLILKRIYSVNFFNIFSTSFPYFLVIPLSSIISRKVSRLFLKKKVGLVEFIQVNTRKKSDCWNSLNNLNIYSMLFKSIFSFLKIKPTLHFVIYKFCFFKFVILLDIKYIK